MKKQTNDYAVLIQGVKGVKWSVKAWIGHCSYYAEYPDEGRATTEALRVQRDVYPRLPVILEEYNEHGKLLWTEKLK